MMQLDVVQRLGADHGATALVSTSIYLQVMRYKTPYNLSSNSSGHLKMVKPEEKYFEQRLVQ
jgi:hypothetical protein